MWNAEATHCRECGYCPEHEKHGGPAHSVDCIVRIIDEMVRAYGLAQQKAKASGTPRDGWWWIMHPEIYRKLVTWNADNFVTQPWRYGGDTNRLFGCPIRQSPDMAESGEGSWRLVALA